MLLAASEVLLEVGCERLTIEDVAERSGVARSTIYRNWGERSALVIDAVEVLIKPHEQPDTGTLRGDLEFLAERVANHLTNEPFGRILPSLIGASFADSGLRERLHHMGEIRFAMGRSVFERAVLRGEIPAADLDARVERFIAPFFTRHLMYGWPIDEAFRRLQVDEAVNSVLDVGSSSS